VWGEQFASGLAAYFGMISLIFLDADAVGASEHFTLVSVSSQWQVFQLEWALVQIAVALTGWFVRS